MESLPVLLAHLDERLAPGEFDDYGPNGLQVPGRAEVELVATGVSASLELFERAEALGAGLVVVHHGLFWRGQPLGLDRRLARRLQVLLGADIALAAYHLPLDAHPELGNNVLLARALGAELQGTFARHGGQAIGRVARFPDPGLRVDELQDRVRAACGRPPLLLGDGPERVRTIGIVSGGAARDVGEAVERGLDAFLTGEPTESVVADAREGAIHLLAAGHYATETLGVRALGDELAGRFAVQHTFIDVPGPV